MPAMQIVQITILSLGLIVIGAIAYGLFLACRGKRLHERILFLALVGPIALGPAVFIWLGLWAGSQRFSAYEHFEENAKKAVTADELQQWATNVLAHPDYSMLKTNFPEKLRKIRWVHVSRIEINTNSDYVMIDFGHIDEHLMAQLYIGPTNFVGFEHVELHKWQDGVYFRSRL